MIDTVFQQAPFDDKRDVQRIEEIAKEVEQRARRTPGYHYARCDRCGYTRNGFARVFDRQFICIRCLINDEVERRFKETT